MAVPMTAAFLITAYGYGCDCKPGNPTKSGIMPVAEHTIAADPKILPLGSIVHIEGLGERQVHDIGGMVKGKHIDVFMTSCSDARKWGRKYRNVRIVHVPEDK